MALNTAFFTSAAAALLAEAAKRRAQQSRPARELGRGGEQRFIPIYTPPRRARRPRRTRPMAVRREDLS
ncbi:MAG: hypothetical protein HYX56_00630 [Chloroflexi bacterium]|nr:hypothetical protein [Chloroflexota bacterium]